MGAGRLRGLVPPAAPRSGRFCSADDLGGREGGPAVFRQPANDDRPRPRDPRRGVSAIGAVLLDLYDTLAWTEWPTMRAELEERFGIGETDLMRAFTTTRKA